ncbi:MAG TPA: MarR family winged helix-turn-helix transcriptional regulator [Ktedonobacteraceae bacterium]|nr:MarR family winged helix-turn-helix transcriptional regulator [Ktedonobacteraceae bacterium]
MPGKTMGSNEHSDLSTHDYQALAEFRHQLRNFLAFSEQAARAVGLEPQQHQLLLTLKGLAGQDRVTISDLAERLKIQHHSTVELVNRMVERDLVQRNRDEQDQRRVLVTLTTHGDEVLRRLSLLHRAELRSAGPDLVRALQIIIGAHPFG